MQDWAAREREVRERLAPLRFLVGTWEGEGLSHGEPIRGRLEARFALGDTFVEARERLFTAAGVLDHEDMTFYRYDPVQQQLKVLQMMAPAWSAEQHVILEDGGIRWFDGPLGPRVVLRPDGADLSVSVTLPLQGEPAVYLHYRRIDAGPAALLSP